MIRLARTTRLGLTGLALSLLVPPALAQQAQPEELPWGKPKAQTQPQPAGNGIMDILPWLIGGDSAKPEKTGPVWSATVGEPVDPAEPLVSDPAMAPGAKIETGAIAQSGLVLKSPIPVGRAGLVNAAAAAQNAENAAKIQRSVPLPGDRPVEQSAASEVSAENSGETPQPSAAEDAPAVAPDAAAPVSPAQITAPAADPTAAAEAAAVVPGAAAVGAPDATETASPDVPAAPPVEHLPAPASPVRPAFPKAKAVNAAPGTMGLAKQKPDTAAPVDNAEQTVAQAAGAAAAEQAPAPQTETTVAAPEAARPVEAAPALPVAEEAPPIPDPLPDAVVTPVPQMPAVTAAEAAPAQAPAATVAPPAEAPRSAAVPGVRPPMPKHLSADASVAQQYCFNIADAAKDARYAWQKKTLADIEVELNKRIALLDARTAEYQKWLARRDEFIRNAEENVVKIMSGMRPDAAAVQLTLMTEESAAAVIAKLSSRNASAVLNEMEPAKAAKLTMIITGAAKLKRKKELQQNQTPAPTQGAAPAPAGAARADAAQPQGGRS